MDFEQAIEVRVWRAGTALPGCELVNKHVPDEQSELPIIAGKRSVSAACPARLGSHRPASRLAWRYGNPNCGSGRPAQLGSERKEDCMVRNQVIIGAVVFAFAVAAAPSNGQAPSNSTTPKANQGSGESEAAKHGTILPEKSLTGGGGQSSSGEAAQIEQSAGPLKLGAAQRQKIKSYFSGRGSERQQNADFSLSIGSAVPRTTELRKLPAEIVSAMGGFQGDDYVLVGDQLVVVDSNARRIVAIVPGVI